VKYVVWSIVGLVIVVVVAVAGFTYWGATMKVDLNDPQVAAKFKENFEASCAANFQKTLANHNVTATAEMLDKMHQLCTCGSDGTADMIKKRGGMSVVDMTTTLNSDPEFKEMNRACAARSGITLPN
jgi:hypothetical protein